MRLSATGCRLRAAGTPGLRPRGPQAVSLQPRSYALTPVESGRIDPLPCLGRFLVSEPAFVAGTAWRRVLIGACLLAMVPSIAFLAGQVPLGNNYDRWGFAVEGRPLRERRRCTLRRAVRGHADEVRARRTSSASIRTSGPMPRPSQQHDVPASRSPGSVAVRRAFTSRDGYTRSSTDSLTRASGRGCGSGSRSDECAEPDVASEGEAAPQCTGRVPRTAQVLTNSACAGKSSPSLVERGANEQH